MTELPQAFLSQMAAQLKGEMAAFLRTYDEPYQRGLRVNPWKRPTLLPDDCGERVPWEENGHYLALTSTAGADVLHEAGAWYLQEPSAMLPASRWLKLLLPPCWFYAIAEAPVPWLAAGAVLLPLSARAAAKLQAGKNLRERRRA